MAIEVTPVQCAGPASGLSVAWEGGQFVMIITGKGMLACGIVDMAVSEKFGFAVAVARGTPEKPLATPDDLLAATVQEVTSRAGEMGVKAGMSGREALDILSR